MDGSMQCKNYKLTDVNGVSCIEWCWSPEDESNNSAKNIRKKEKDYVGSCNLDTPMLDSRRSGVSSIYCDIIIVTNNLSSWEATIKEEFSSYLQTHSLLSGGHQITFSNKADSSPFFSANFYPRTKKMMIQPGQRNESNLLEWLSHYTKMKSVVTQMISHPLDLNQPLTTKDTATQKEVPRSPTSAPENDWKYHTEKDIFVCLCHLYPSSFGSKSTPDYQWLGYPEKSSSQSYLYARKRWF